MERRQDANLGATRHVWIHSNRDRLTDGEQEAFLFCERWKERRREPDWTDGPSVHHTNRTRQSGSRSERLQCATTSCSPDWLQCEVMSNCQGRSEAEHTMKDLQREAVSTALTVKIPSNPMGHHLQCKKSMEYKMFFISSSLTCWFSVT